MADYTLVIKAVDQTQGTLRNIEGGLGNLSGAASVATRALGLAAAAAAAIGAAIGAAAVKSVQAATEVQNLGIRLTALVGSAEGGAAALDAMRKAAENLPFSLQEIERASPSLLTVSKDTNEFKKNLQLTADLAAVTGLTYQETAQQLQRAFSAGANSADLFRERGVLALAGFQAGATVSIEETRKKFLELGERIQGTANELNKTLPGAISQLTDQLTKLQVAFGQPITEALAAGLNVLVGDLAKTSGTAQETAKVMGQNFTLAIADAIDFVALIIDAVAGLIDTFQPFINIVVQAAKIVGDLLVRAFGLAGAAVLEFGRAFGAITDAIGLTDGLEQKATNLQRAYLNLAKDGAAGLGKFAKDGLGAVAGATNSARTAASRYTDAIRQSIAAQREANKTTEEYGNVANKNFTDAASAAQQNFTKIRESIAQARANLLTLLEQFKRTADFSLRLRLADEIDKLRKSLGDASPVILSLEERLKSARNQYTTFSSAQEAAAEEAERLGQAYLNGDIKLQQFLQTATKVNDAFKTRTQLSAETKGALETEAQVLQRNKDALTQVSNAYTLGTATQAQYIAALEKIPEAVRTPTEVLTLLEEKFKQQQTVIANQLPALTALRQQYESGAITAEQYQQKVTALSAAISTTPKSITDVVAAAEAQAKANRNNIALQSQLNQRLADGTIKFDEYRIAAQNIGIPEGEVERNITSIGTVETRFAAFSDNVRKYSQEAADNFSNSFVDAILQGKNALNSFKDFFGNILKYIAAQILKAQIADPIAKALTGAIGGIFGGSGGSGGVGGTLFGAIGKAIGGMFGGFFAEGGTIPGNKVSVVGERGPELFVPGRTGTVVPNDALAGGGGDTINVNFSINAVDTQTGVEFLMKNKQVLTSVIEQAYNKRGRRGPVSIG